MDRKIFDDWMQTRPDCIKQLAREFPLHTKLSEGYVIGWHEDDMLIVSPITLDDDYDIALRQSRHVCAKHFRN